MDLCNVTYSIWVCMKFKVYIVQISAPEKLGSSCMRTRAYILPYRNSFFNNRNTLRRKTNQFFWFWNEDKNLILYFEIDLETSVKMYIWVVWISGSAFPPSRVRELTERFLRSFIWVAIRVQILEELKNPFGH